MSWRNNPVTVIVSDSHKWVNLAAHLIFGLLFIMAAMFYKERLFSEPASDIFYLFNVETFYFVHQRYVLFFSQWLPRLAILLELPLKQVLILYSVGHVLFFYMLYAFCQFYLRDTRAAVSVLCVLSLPVLYTFFNTPMAEIWFGSGLLIVLYFMLINDRHNTLLGFGLFLIIAFFTTHSHPAIFPIMLVLLVVDALKRRRPLKIYLSLALLISFGLLNIDQYETESMVGSYLSNESGSESISFAYLKQLIYFQLFRYEVLIAMLSIVVLIFSINRKWLSLFVTLSGFIIYTALISYHSGIIADCVSGGLEIYYIPSAALIVPLFLTNVLPLFNKNGQIVIYAFVLASVALHILAIYNKAPLFTQRVEMIERLNAHAQSLPGDKFSFESQNTVQNNTTRSWWSMPVESILFSAVEGKENTVNICPKQVVNFEYYADSMTDESFRWLFGDERNSSYLNPVYFQLESGPFRELNTNSETEFKLSIELLEQEPLKFQTVETHQASIGMEEMEFMIRLNLTAEFGTVPSKIETGHYLSYRWLFDGTEIEHEAIASPLEVDIHEHYIQPVGLRLPQTKGDYTLQFGLCKIDTLNTAASERFRFTTPDSKLKWLALSDSYEVIIE